MDTSKIEIATLGGGCFWCVEAVFQELKGVEKVVSGYAGGHIKNPSYREVCQGTTGHAEVVQVYFDPEVIDFETILKVFFTTHDPTTLNRQGADRGTQYRSIILYHSPQQEAKAGQVLSEFVPTLWDNPVVTQLVPFEKFYPAEDYHQNYFADNSNQPYCQIVIQPKVLKLRKTFREMLKN